MLQWFSLFDLRALCSQAAFSAIYVGSLVVIGFDSCWVIVLWVLPSGWLTWSHTTHHVLYAVIQVLSEQNKTTQETSPHP